MAGIIEDVGAPVAADRIQEALEGQAVMQILERLKVYPLDAAGTPPSVDVINASGNVANLVPPYEPDGKLHVEAPDQTVATLADFLEIWRRSANPSIPDAVAAGLAEIRVVGELVPNAASVVLADGLGIEITIKSFPTK